MTKYIFIFLFLLFYAKNNTLFAQDSLSQYPKKEKLEMYEKSFKPSSYEENFILPQKKETLTLTFDTTTVALPETLQGFRIQITITKNFDEVSNLKTTLQNEFRDVWIYVVYDAPTYKLRIGNFVNRVEANLFLEKLHSMGYKEAWVVPDNVIINQPPPPLPLEIIKSDSTIQQE